MKAPLPPNEARRLETLRGYDVLDTLPEPAFDDLTLLAAQICQVPIAVVSLVDEKRQWFKSIIGLSVAETSRDVAFCAHAILNSDEVLEVRDAQLDPRFADNPLVTTDPHIRFYAGAPLVAPDGLALGTLCVIDRVPRVLSAEQKASLRALSRTVILQLELHRTLAAHRLAEEQLQSLNAALDQKVEARTAELRREMEVRRESETRTQLILDMAMDAVISINQEGIVIGWNNEAERMFGYAADHALGKELAELIVPPAYRKAHKEGMQRFVKTGSSTIIGKRVEMTGMRADSSEIPVELTIVAILRQGSYYFNAFVRDITERKRAEIELRIAATAFESHESLMITDANRVILRVNQTFTEDTGYTAEEVVGQTPRMLKSGRHNAEFYRAMWKTINRTGTWQGEIWDRRKNGEIYPKWLTITAVKGDDGVVTQYVGSHIDITERKAAEEKIQYLAFYDLLTGLPNRQLLLDRFQQTFASSARSGRKGAVLLIDLDNFKDINDTLGHDIGDSLLQQTAQRLKSCMREGDTVARPGSDEFVVVLENLSEQHIEAATQTEAISEKILAALSKPYHLAKYEYQGTASIGATLINGHQQTAEELLKQADIAMYQAKKAGRNTLRFFDPQMQASITGRFSLEGELHKALEKQQFQLYYQIQVDSSYHPLGAEALIRWIHPLRGMVSPAQFIPLAEKTGLILPIGQWVLETACAQIKAWEQDALTRDLVLAVNVSAKQFRQAAFVAQVQAAVQHHAINPMLLKLELTEGMLLENIEDTIATMNTLNEIGVQFSLDDFGTGYSSLQYLKRLPLDQIKIDQSFVRDIVIDDSDKAIVRTIIAMAQSLNLNVIAEGVETAAHRQQLLVMGCHNFQGYLFSKPVPIEQFEALLRQG